MGDAVSRHRAGSATLVETKVTAAIFNKISITCCVASSLSEAKSSSSCVLAILRMPAIRAADHSTPFSAAVLYGMLRYPAREREGARAPDVVTRGE